VGRGEAVFEELEGTFAHQRREDVTAVLKSQLKRPGVNDGGLTSS
jgi:hypothetical protein